MIPGANTSANSTSACVYELVLSPVPSVPLTWIELFMIFSPFPSHLTFRFECSCTCPTWLYNLIVSLMLQPTLSVESLKNSFAASLKAKTSFSLSASFICLMLIFSIVSSPCTSVFFSTLTFSRASLTCTESFSMDSFVLASFSSEAGSGSGAGSSAGAGASGSGAGSGAGASGSSSFTCLFFVSSTIGASLLFFDSASCTAC